MADGEIRLPKGEAELFRLDRPTCSVCGKMFERGPQGITQKDNREMAQINSGFDRDLDLCPQCRKEHAHEVRTICAKCGRIVPPGRMPPGATTSGYYAGPDTDLHVDGCPMCSREVYKALLEAASKGGDYFAPFVEDKVFEQSKTRVHVERK